MKTSYIMEYERQYRALRQANAKNDTIVPVKKAKVTTPQSASNSSDVRKTIAEFDFTNKVIKLMKTRPIYYAPLMKFDTIEEMYKQVWYVLHSPKVCAVTFRTIFYGKKIKSMISYAEMIGLAIDIFVPNNKFHTSREFTVWFNEQQTHIHECDMSVENTNLITKHARELIKYARSNRTYITVTDTGMTITSELIEVLKEQIKSAGYDVSMYSMVTTDGLNSGVIEDGKGKHEWSRTYTKYYDRYNQTLNDLLNMYISCKAYKAIGYAVESKDGIGTNDIDTYTGEDISYIPIAIDIYQDDVVVPRSACGLGLQSYMN